MELVLIRHGRPQRVEGQAGQADPGLTDNGHLQSAKLAQWLVSEDFDSIYTSTMRRARETAEPFEKLTGLAAVAVDGIREYDDTSSSYIPMEELKQDRNAYRVWLENHMPSAGDGDFYQTVVTSIEQIIDENQGKKVAVFCHGGVINAWTCHVQGMDFRMFLDVNYTSINRFMASSAGTRSVYSLNDYGHLRELPELQVH